MNLLSEALSISGIGILVVFAVLVVLMWFLMLVARLFGERTKTTEEAHRTPLVQHEQARKLEPTAAGSDAVTAEETAAIMAALRATYRDFPWGGRVRIEEVSRQR